jgi:aminoglycoside phosphotransferase (APT) family kinase protein
MGKLSPTRHDAPGPPRGGGRFSFRIVDLPRPSVEKRGESESLAREARALRRLVGRDIAPALVAHGDGVLCTALLEGRPRVLSRRDRASLAELGAVLRRAHDTACHASGRLPQWSSAARSLSSYRARRAEDARASAGRQRGLAERVIAGLPFLPPTDHARPFRFLHGDLVHDNVVWTPAGPRLVDWEFWRMGDPAEDLAYLIELNDLRGEAEAAVLSGYGASDLPERVDAWRALVVLDAGLWYLNHGEKQRAEPLLQRADRLSR